MVKEVLWVSVSCLSGVAVGCLSAYQEWYEFDSNTFYVLVGIVAGYLMAGGLR